MAVRVHLADDHTMFRDGLESILTSSGDGIEVVGRSSTGGEDAIALVEKNRPAMFDNLHYLQALSRLEIDAYIHKSASSEELLATVDTLSRRPDGGNAVVSMPRDLLQRLGEEPVSVLSEREIDILVLAARGLSNLQIAPRPRAVCPCSDSRPGCSASARPRRWTRCGASASAKGPIATGACTLPLAFG